MKGKSPAQILLRFQTKRNVIVIPKSENEKRQKDNFDLNFDLNEDEMEKMEKLNQNCRSWTEERVMHSKYFPKW